MNTSSTNTPILDDDAITEIEARSKTGHYPSLENVAALCATVRAERWFHRAANTSFEDGIASQCDAWPIRNLILEASANQKGEMNG